MYHYTETIEINDDLSIEQWVDNDTDSIGYALRGKGEQGDFLYTVDNCGVLFENSDNTVKRLGMVTRRSNGWVFYHKDSRTTEIKSNSIYMVDAEIEYIKSLF